MPSSLEVRNLPLRLGLVGAGRIARIHARSVRRASGLELVAVADSNKEAADHLAAAEGIAAAYGSVSELLERNSVDAVLICAHTTSHVDLISEVVDARKHVFCEKPVAHSPRAIRQLRGLVDDTGVEVQVGFNRRFDPNNISLKQAIVTGQIGRVRQVNMTSRDPHLPDDVSYLGTSGGLFLDLAVHDFDLARFFMDDEVSDVFATGAVLADERVADYDDVDTAVTLLRFASGGLATIDNTRVAAYGYDQRAEVLGSAGAIESKNCRSSNVVLHDDSGAHKPAIHRFFEDRYPTAFANELDAFAAVVRGEESPSVDLVDAERAVEIAAAAAVSARERRWVSIEEVRNT